MISKRIDSTSVLLPSVSICVAMPATSLPAASWHVLHQQQLPGWLPVLIDVQTAWDVCVLYMFMCKFWDDNSLIFASFLQCGKRILAPPCISLASLCCNSSKRRCASSARCAARKATMRCCCNAAYWADRPPSPQWITSAWHVRSEFLLDAQSSNIFQHGKTVLAHYLQDWRLYSSEFQERRGS